MDCFIQYFLKNKIKIVDTNYLSGITVVVKKTIYNQIKNKIGDKTMKKVLLTSVVDLAVLSAVAPAFADNNGGANLPGVDDSREAYESQSEFVTANRVNAYVDAHIKDLKEPAEVAKAEADLQAFLDSVYSGYDFSNKKAALEKAVGEAKEAYNAKVVELRNEAVKHLQEVFNSSLKKEGKYYILNETLEQANARYLKDHAQDGQTAPSATPEPGKPDSIEQAKQAGAIAKAGQKALPKTHASK